MPIKHEITSLKLSHGFENLEEISFVPENLAVLTQFVINMNVANGDAGWVADMLHTAELPYEHIEKPAQARNLERQLEAARRLEDFFSGHPELTKVFEF